MSPTAMIKTSAALYATLTGREKGGVKREHKKYKGTRGLVLLTLYAPTSTMGLFVYEINH